jgi:ATP-binding cassette subfamily C protein
VTGTARAHPFRALLTDVRSVAGRQLRASAALTLFGAFAEGAGLLILLPMLSLLSNGHGRVADRLGAILPPRLLLPAILMLFLVVMTARAAILLARDRSVARLENDYDVSLRLRVAVTLADHGWPAAARIGQSGMQSILANDIPRSVTAVHYAIQAATAAFLLTVQLALAAWLSWPLAVAALVILAFGIPWLIALTRLGERSGEQMAAGQQDSTRAAYEFHAALKVALAQGSVAGFIDAYRSRLLSLAGHYNGFAFAMARSRTTHSIGAAIAGALIVGAGYSLSIDLPRLIALLVLFSRMSGPAQGLQQALGLLSSFLPSFAHIGVALGELSPLHALPPPAARVAVDRREQPRVRARWRRRPCPGGFHACPRRVACTQRPVGCWQDDPDRHCRRPPSTDRRDSKDRRQPSRRASGQGVARLAVLRRAAGSAVRTHHPRRAWRRARPALLGRAPTSRSFFP